MQEATSTDVEMSPSMTRWTNIANTLILSKLWHVVIHVASFPQVALKKIKSTIYQFVISWLFAPLKGNSFFLPRDQRGLGLVDIGVQQKVLQFWYLRVLLVGNNDLLPDFTYQLLNNALRPTNDAAHHALPLLFSSALYKNAQHLPPWRRFAMPWPIVSCHHSFEKCRRNVFPAFRCYLNGLPTASNTHATE